LNQTTSSEPLDRLRGRQLRVISRGRRWDPAAQGAATRSLLLVRCGHLVTARAPTALRVAPRIRVGHVPLASPSPGLQRRQTAPPIRVALASSAQRHHVTDHCRQRTTSACRSRCLPPDRSHSRNGSQAHSCDASDGVRFDDRLARWTWAMLRGVDGSAHSVAQVGLTSPVVRGTAAAADRGARTSWGRRPVCCRAASAPHQGRSRSVRSCRIRYSRRTGTDRRV